MTTQSLLIWETFTKFTSYSRDVIFVGENIAFVQFPILCLKKREFSVSLYCCLLRFVAKFSYPYNSVLMLSEFLCTQGHCSHYTGSHSAVFIKYCKHLQSSIFFSEELRDHYYCPCVGPAQNWVVHFSWCELVSQ